MRPGSRDQSRVWLSWWERTGTLRRFGPLLGLGGYALLLLSLGGLQPKHELLIAGLLLLAYSGPRVDPFFRFALPFGLVMLLYDSMGLYKDKIRGTIRISELYRFDQLLFGIRTESGHVLTPNEWWQAHTYPLLDFYTGFFYIFFLALFFFTAAYFRFVNRRTRNRPASARISWAFLWVNAIGYLTYFIYPAAPPWYVARFGFGPPRMDTLASPAGGLRFDAMTGIPLFKTFYGASQDVFGAVPSLHVAYPLLAVCYAFQMKTARGWTVFFFLTMCFSAVYLNHHYVVDLIWGSAYALAVYFSLEWVAGWSERRRIREIRHILRTPARDTEAA